MREFTPEIIEEIKEEINFIFTLHEAVRLEGEMRLFAPPSKQVWQSAEAGFEAWITRDTIDSALGKLVLFYRNGSTPNTTLFLDPILYKRSETDGSITPIGSGFTFATGYCKQGASIDPNTFKRLKEIGAWYDFLQAAYPDGSESEQAGLKVILPVKEPIQPATPQHTPHGNPARGTQALADFMDINSEDIGGLYYPLGGLMYTREEGRYQQPSFKNIIPTKQILPLKDVATYQHFVNKVENAATCWNAYDRSQVIYDRYGIDVSNLEDNLRAKEESDAKLKAAINELKTLWHSHKRFDLNGYMRLYTIPDQAIFRTKQEGLELWYEDTEESYNKLFEELQYYYNAGVLPNSPPLVDPIVYRKEGDNFIPIGTSVTWATAFYTGQAVYNEHDLARIKQVGCMTGGFIRAGVTRSGFKILAFLDTPYRFSEEAQTKLRGQRDQSVPHGLTIPGCEELFNISNVNGTAYAPYYLLTGIEYLCQNGSYASETMEESFDGEQINRDELIQRYTVSQEYIQEANRCWNKYDKLHPLWERFGIDGKNLEKNLKYYMLCGRDFNLLNMTGESRSDKESEFEFLVPGWIPKAAITIIGATGGTGKSSLAHRLAVLTSSDWTEDDPNPKWLGSEIAKEDCQGISVYFSGEDAASIVNARAKIFDPEGKSSRLMLKTGAEFGTHSDGSPKAIGDFLEELHVLPKVDVVVIDPARKYLLGDEDDSEVVSDFFEAIEKFAVEKNCGMIVVHHLQKQAHPRDTRDIADMLRGSQVFIDRARVVIGMMRDGAYTLAGLAKNNIPPGLGMVEGERVLARDPERLDLIWLPGPEGVRHFDVTEEELKEIKNKLEAEQEQHDKNAKADDASATSETTSSADSTDTDVEASSDNDQDAPTNLSQAN